MSALLPPGFRFQPSDIELIGYYLRRKLAGALISVPQFLIRDFDIYSTEPWNLPSDSFRYQSEKKDMYFFTPRRPTTKGSQRADRTAGCGMWQGNGADYCIKDGSKTIGHRTQLTFMSGKEKKKTNWIMHEFRLHSPSNTTKFDAMVLCRIHLKKTRKCREEEVDTDAAAAVVGSAFGEKEEEEAEGRLVRRKRVEERGLITDYGLVNTESSSQSSSSLLPGMLALVSYEEPEVLTPLTSDVASVADNVPVSEQEAETEERRVIRRLLEELKKMTNNGEKGTNGIFYPESSAEHASLLSYEEPGVPALLTPVVAGVSVAVDEQEEAETEERQVKRRRVKESEQQQGLIADNDERGSCGFDNTESTSHPSSLNGDFPLADQLFVEDLGQFPPLDTEFHTSSSSSFLAPLPAANHVPDCNFVDDFRCLPLDCWEESESLALLALNDLDLGSLSSFEDLFDDNGQLIAFSSF